jgi:hypothetical protein
VQGDALAEDPTEAADLAKYAELVDGLALSIQRAVLDLRSEALGMQDEPAMPTTDHDVALDNMARTLQRISDMAAQARDVSTMLRDAASATSMDLFRLESMQRQWTRMREAVRLLKHEPAYDVLLRVLNDPAAPVHEPQCALPCAWCETRALLAAVAMGQADLL